MKNILFQAAGSGEASGTNIQIYSVFFQRFQKLLHLESSMHGENY